MSRTGFLHHPACLEHVTGAGHPERPARLETVVRALEQSGIAADLARETVRCATREELAAVHDPAYLDRVDAAMQRAPTYLDSGDTPVSEGSRLAALLAAGAAAQAAEKIAAGEWQNAFVAVRPPGHHAERDAAMGFCIYNNAALAAALLRKRHGLDRVAILDWDVHHGNGTQHIFERDPSVFYASLHQFPHYPGTGAASEVGLGEGEGATYNAPLASGTGDAQWIGALENELAPRLEAFAPQAIVLSAGFDAHELDPLSGTRVTTAGYARMTAIVLDLAQRVCAGRVLSLLEGGYDLTGLGEGARAHVEALVEGSRSCA